MWKKILILIILFTMWFAVLGALNYTVDAQGGAFNPESCARNDDGSLPPECRPPTLQQFEFLFARLVYWMWAVGGLIWTFYLLLIGYTIAKDPSNQENYAAAKTRALKWVLGVFIFYLSFNLIGVVYRMFLNDTPGCYEELRDPGFRFFFRDVCED